MASVRERARVMDLTLKLAALSPARRAELPTMKPFRATRIWCNIIVALQSEVEVKRRRHHLKHHDDCFLGSDAVDLILSHLLQNNYFGQAEISRSKVVRLCQALMDNKVYEAVGTKLFGKDKESTFEDSNCSLYRFTTMHRWVDVVNECQAPSPGFNGLCRRQERVHFSTCTDTNPHDSSLEELLSNLSLKPVTSSHIETSQLSQTVVDEVWQEQTILRLLQLIELPILDTLLDRKEHRSKPQNESTKTDVITNDLLDREILKAFGDSRENDWLSSAIDLLEFLPDSRVVEISRNLPESSSDIDQCKMLLFDAIAKHYNQTKDPLLANDFFDIHTGVAELLVNGKFEPALEATQLCLKLLDSRNRDELKRLLHFTTQPASIALQTGIENRIVMKRTFGKAIVSNKNLPKGKADLLVLFLLDHHKDVFKVPGSLHKMVSEKLMLIQNGGDPDRDTGHTYCERLTHAACESNMRKTTRDELLLLLKTIDENPKLPAKEKKKVLSQFNKSHPAVFIQYFFNALRKS
ncbi:DEP domain-containing protein 7 isoform X1 [Scyliorhinus torazame]|uniref:DEP domain-containing protein 7 isoform X1 n=1 Tax=Scyliorhinus torazame TaxID=75743 RepID=UPI003B59D90C